MDQIVGVKNCNNTLLREWRLDEIRASTSLPLRCWIAIHNQWGINNDQAHRHLKCVHTTISLRYTGIL